MITVVEKQVVWLVSNIYTNQHTSTGRVETTIYGKEQDAVAEFSRRIREGLPRDTPTLVLEHEIELGLANSCYQLDCDEDICVVCIDKDVVN